MATEMKTKKPKKGLESYVDTGGTVSYSLVVGALLDYAAGQNLSGIATSRGSATVLNLVTGAPYGKWRNWMYRITKTTDKSSKRRQYFTDLLAFNTFQVPIYAIAASSGTLVSEGHIDLNKVWHGSLYLATISPFIGPTRGWYMDRLRKLFKLKSAPEKAYSGRSRWQ